MFAHARSLLVQHNYSGKTTLIFLAQTLRMQQDFTSPKLADKLQSSIKHDKQSGKH